MRELEDKNAIKHPWKIGGQLADGLKDVEKTLEVVDMCMDISKKKLL